MNTVCYLAKNHDDDKINDGSCGGHHLVGIGLECRVLVQGVDDEQFVHNDTHHEQHHK